MQADYTVTGKIIARYQLPLDEVDELNEIYENYDKLCTYY